MKTLKFAFNINRPLILANFSVFFLCIYMALFLSRNYWSSLDLMASIWENVISILTGNLNSGCSYLITAVTISGQICRNKISILFFNKHRLLILLITFAARSGAHSKFLQKLILPVIPLKECKSKFGDYLGIQNITQKQICAGGINGKFMIFIPFG